MEAPRRAVYLSLSVEDQNGKELNYSSDSSDSPRASTHSSEDCSVMTSAENLNRKVIVQSENMDMVDCVATLNNNSNQNVTFMISGLQNGSVYSGSSMSCVRSVVVQKSDRVVEKCLDFEADKVFNMGSVNPSSHGLCEICSSVSSDEMVIRGSSFIIHEPDDILSASVLEQSPDKLSDVGLMPGLLPDVCEGLVNNIINISEEGSKHHEFGVTFIQPNNQTFIMEEEVFQTVSGSVGSHKGSGESRYLDFLTVVDCSDCITPVCQKKFHTEAQKSTNSTPGEAKTFHIPAEELDISGNVQTSTPVQSLTGKTCLLSLSDSLINKGKSDLGSPITEVMKEPQSSASQKPKTPLTAPAKSNKIQTKRFVKPDFSNMKSKILPRPVSTFKPSTVAVVKASTNLVKRPSQSMEHKASLTSSTKPEVSSNLKKDQNGLIKRKPSTSQDGTHIAKSRHHTWSEASNTNGEESCVKDQQVSKTSDNCTTAKTSSVGLKSRFGLTKQGKEEKHGSGWNMWKKPQKSASKTDSSRPAEVGSCDWSKNSAAAQPSSSRTGGAPAGQTPAASPQPLTLSASKLKSGTAGKNGCIATDMPSQRRGGNSNMHVTEAARTEGSGGTHSRSSLSAAHPHASKLPVKPRAQIKSFNASSGLSKPDLEPPSGGKAPSTRTTVIKSRVQSLPPKTPSSGYKNTSSLSQTSVRTSSSISKTPNSSRPVRVSGALSVDKNRTKASTQSQQQSQINGQPDLVPPETKPRGLDYYKTLCEKKNQTIQQLRSSLLANNHKFEAITIVVQNLYTQHEDAVKQRRELSVELLNLRQELVSSAQSCDLLEKEKDELNAAFDGVLQKVQEQHRSDLVDLEQRLKTFYSAEWEKVHQTYQEEADKCRAQMEKQLEELRANHEVLKKELEASHDEKVKSLNKNYEESFEELKKYHEQEIQALVKTQKDTELLLSNQIEELTTVNNSLSERIKAEEDRRRDLAEKCQKDSHTLYLEQELESLKFVLDIKNKQIHQQDKKLMQMDKLMERNVQLDEYLKKLQQENEDLKARMDKHAALSRQLSTEQAVLQESLQKETKVNKRLSMENEELLWKLHNGDLSSPRKISPSSPSMTLQSPCHSGIFSSPPVSPR
ncbi:microtubule-associated tumor suppressor 1 homolog A isoform X1 [Trichomycterus rosablanca]|uniref:microtubule-associated tumor suppressor 1 homolog A isoform X1 n=1 Tax=Trichomycterus rosablanca TaxID=2290929 RepID=UPI002F35BD19